MELILTKELNKLHFGNQTDSYQKKVRDYIAYIRSTSSCLKVKSGKEALRLMLRSKRIYEDLTFAELAGQSRFDLQFEVREWCDEVYPEWEFRLFIWNHKLTCATQYHKDVYVPEISLQREKICELIQEFYLKEISGKIPSNCPNLTVDIAIKPDLRTVWLIEIGNPPPVAGTALYDWDNEHHKDIIMNGKDGKFCLSVLDHLNPENWKNMHKVVSTVIAKYHNLPKHNFSCFDEDIQSDFQPFYVYISMIALIGGIVYSIWKNK